MTERFDIAVIGAGPAGAATAIRAARGGARVLVVDAAAHGRDKVCGDGLTPRAVAALHDLEIPLDDAHRIDGLRMIAGKQTRELLWPADGTIPRRRRGVAATSARQGVDRRRRRRGRRGPLGDPR